MDELRYQRVQAELLVDIAGLQPISLIEPALEYFDARQVEFQSPRLELREQIEVGDTFGAVCLLNVHQIS